MINVITPELKEKILRECERLFEESKKYVLPDQLENWKKHIYEYVETYVEFFVDKPEEQEIIKIDKDSDLQVAIDIMSILASSDPIRMEEVSSKYDFIYSDFPNSMTIYRSIRDFSIKTTEFMAALKTTDIPNLVALRKDADQLAENTKRAEIIEKIKKEYRERKRLEKQSSIVKYPNGDELKIQDKLISGLENEGILIKNENNEYVISEEGVIEYIQGSLKREIEARELSLPALLGSVRLEISSIDESLNEYMRRRSKLERTEGRKAAIKSSYEFLPQKIQALEVDEWDFNFFTYARYTEEDLELFNNYNEDDYDYYNYNDNSKDLEDKFLANQEKLNRILAVELENLICEIAETMYEQEQLPKEVISKITDRDNLIKKMYNEECVPIISKIEAINAAITCIRDEHDIEESNLGDNPGDYKAPYKPLNYYDGFPWDKGL